MMKVANRFLFGLISYGILLGCPQSAKETQSNHAGEGSGQAQGICDIDQYQAPRVTHFVQGAIIRIGRPSYPPDALKRSVEGQVNVDILIDREGTVVKACALDGPPELRKAAEIGALSCKFKENFGLAKPGPRPYQRDVISYLFVADPRRQVDEGHSIVVRPEK